MIPAPTTPITSNVIDDQLLEMKPFRAHRLRTPPWRREEPSITESKPTDTRRTGGVPSRVWAERLPPYQGTGMNCNRSSSSLSRRSHWCLRGVSTCSGMTTSDPSLGWKVFWLALASRNVLSAAICSLEKRDFNTLGTHFFSTLLRPTNQTRVFTTTRERPDHRPIFGGSIGSKNTIGLRAADAL